MHCIIALTFVFYQVWSLDLRLLCLVIKNRLVLLSLFKKGGRVLVVQFILKAVVSKVCFATGCVVLWHVLYVDIGKDSWVQRWPPNFAICTLLVFRGMDDWITFWIFLSLVLFSLWYLLWSLRRYLHLIHNEISNLIILLEIVPFLVSYFLLWPYARLVLIDDLVLILHQLFLFL